MTGTAALILLQEEQRSAWIGKLNATTLKDFGITPGKMGPWEKDLVAKPTRQETWARGV